MYFGANGWRRVAEGGCAFEISPSPKSTEHHTCTPSSPRTVGVPYCGSESGLPTYTSVRSTAARYGTKNTFLVIPGKCGHAYFVPHFTSSGYSGNVVEVELQTDRLGSVRLHGVVTDFADFYSDGGVGPYTGQVNGGAMRLGSRSGSCHSR